jgi:hypothetical protein
MKTNSFFIIAIALFAFSASLWSQEAPADGSTSASAVSIAGAYTDLKEAAVRLAAQILPKVNITKFSDKGKCIGYLGVALDMAVGSEDVFESLNGKVSGFVWLPLPDDEDGEPDTDGWIHVLPFSVGLETNRDFTDYAVLAELGYTPVGPVYPKTEGRHSLRFGMDPLFNAGLFIQAGYKVASLPKGGEGGNEVASPEEAGDAILRLKAAASLYLEPLKNLFVSCKPKGWFDVLNLEFYYQVSGELSYTIEGPENPVTLFVGYDKGSGAPYFNTGDQFSGGLKIAF